MGEALALAADLLVEPLVGVPLAPEGREVLEVPGAEVPVAEVPGAEEPATESEPVPEGTPLETMGGVTMSNDRYEAKGSHRTCGTSLHLESLGGGCLSRAVGRDLLTRGVHVIRSSVKHTR